MKNSIIVSSIFFSILVMGLSACKEKHDHDNTATITVSKPIENAQFHHGDTVFINAVITAESAMHGWEVQIRKKSDLSVVFEQDAHDHAATFNINTYWVNNLGSAHNDMELVVTAEINHDGNTESKTVNFHCH
ncbi:MAG: hypothetical protein MH137_13375 [Flavobacteriales bacterium]|nr:hypothetical protein [Flavobacteriales bacterium]